MQPPEIIAHRGLHQVARENTIDAFDRALRAGAQAIELDVHGTADGEIVVHHDFEITLPSNSIAIRESTLSETVEAGLRLGFALPTLGEVLKRCAGQLKVYIEVKAPGIELLVARIVRESDCELAIHSFDHRISKKMRELVPGLETGILTVSRPVNPVALLRTSESTHYWPQADFVDQELVNDIHESGGKVIVWTANRPDQWERLTSLGVDGLCTDRPDLLREWMQQQLTERYPSQSA